MIRLQSELIENNQSIN